MNFGSTAAASAYCCYVVADHCADSCGYANPSSTGVGTVPLFDCLFLHVHLLSITVWECTYRYIRKDMFVEVGKSEVSPNFESILQMLLSQGEYLAFIPDSVETKTMLSILSLKFPLLKVLLFRIINLHGEIFLLCC